jgi:large subunit ribosomal protein L29
VKENRPAKLRGLTVEELQAKLRQLREEMFNLRFRNSMSQLDNPQRIREVRRDIARMETLLTENRTGLRRLAEHKV